MNTEECRIIVQRLSALEANLTEQKNTLVNLMIAMTGATVWNTTAAFQWKTEVDPWGTEVTTKIEELNLLLNRLANEITQWEETASTF